MKSMLTQCWASTSTWCATTLLGQRMTTCTFRTSSAMVSVTGAWQYCIQLIEDRILWEKSGSHQGQLLGRYCSEKFSGAQLSTEMFWWL